MSVFVLIGLAGCQATDNASSPEPAAEHIKGPTVPSKCGSPPVLDTAAIETMLMKSGKITETMSRAERDRIVREFIARKQAAYRCQVAPTLDKPF
ncbi:MAG: hypothetical protein D6694_08570 [Gammaproteobacteria bacterium]|nr:MAG: hypothetical protein D6694_08570 [Gammaproteobacteria bacterium]